MFRYKKSIHGTSQCYQRDINCACQRLTNSTWGSAFVTNFLGMLCCLNNSTAIAKKWKQWTDLTHQQIQSVQPWQETSPGGYTLPLTRWTMALVHRWPCSSTPSALESRWLPWFVVNWKVKTDLLVQKKMNKRTAKSKKNRVKTVLRNFQMYDSKKTEKNLYKKGMHDPKPKQCDHSYSK